MRGAVFCFLWGIFIGICLGEFAAHKDLANSSIVLEKKQWNCDETKQISDGAQFPLGFEACTTWSHK